MGAGILPIAIHLGKIYLLFSREYINANVNPGLWCDFGGAKDNNESYKQTAIREGWEESSGILGSKTTVKYGNGFRDYTNVVEAIKENYYKARIHQTVEYVTRMRNKYLVSIF